MISMLLACENNSKILDNSYKSEVINLPINEADSLLFKSIYQFEDTLMTIFLDKGKGLIVQSYFIDSNLVKTDTSWLGYSIKEQCDIQCTIDKDLLIYTPQDSIVLTILSLNSKKEYFKETFLTHNKVSFSEQTNLISNAKSTMSGFEYRISTTSPNANSPMTGVFDFETNKINFTGINYPERYLNNYFGFLHEIQEVYTDEYILYNPIALPEIWVYNRSTKSVDVKEIKSQFHLKEVKPISAEEKLRSDIRSKLEEHNASNGNYSRLIYNRHQNCYYRFYQHPQLPRTTDGYFTTYQDRLVSCIKIDSDFKVISEIVLPENCFFIYVAIPTENGFIVNNGPLFQNNRMSLLKVTF